jgi:hypothetical protein
MDTGFATNAEQSALPDEASVETASQNVWAQVCESRADCEGTLMARGYRPASSFISKDPERRAKQLANLVGGKKVKPPIRFGVSTSVATNFKTPDPSIWANPVESAKAILGVSLWAKQEELLLAIRDNAQTACRSANAAGKTFVLAVAIVLWLLAYEDAVCVSTSSSGRQLKILWRNVHRLYRSVKKLLPGTLNQMELRISEDRYAVGVSANIPENLGGFHSGHVLTIADESSSLEEAHAEALLSNGTGPDDRVVLSGNPLRPAGPFFDSSRSGDWHTMSISALDVPGVQDDQKPIPGLASRAWIERRKAAWGEESPAYLARVLGQFPDSSEDTLFNLSDVELACERTAEPTGARIGSVDVARFGPDKNTFIVRQGDCILHVEFWTKSDLMNSCGRLMELNRQWDLKVLIVDETGLGSGLVDRLKELKVNVIGVNAASKACDEVRFGNRRAELFWALKDRIKTLAIPYRYKDQFQELANLKYRFASNGRILCESKDEIKARLGRSPDFADCLALSLATEVGKPKKPVVFDLGGLGDRLWKPSPFGPRLPRPHWSG